MKTKFIFSISLILLSLNLSAEPIEKNLTFKARGPKGTFSLNAIFLTDSKFFHPPLVMLAHGSSLDPSSASKIVPEIMLGPAHEFLKLGFASLIVERRGFGHSKEKFVEIIGDCAHRDNLASGLETNIDILGGIDFAQKNLDIDKKKIVLAGHSAGGFASIFAGGYAEEKHLQGLKAVINFGGGRGYHGDHVVCGQENLFKAYGLAGQKTHFPTLWVYAENDEVFPPALAKKMFEAFKPGNKEGTFLIAPPFDDDGHSLFIAPQGISIWLPMIKDFLQKINLCPLCS